MRLQFIYRASDKCKNEKRKILNGDDLIWAMDVLGFDDYVEPLTTYLTKYKEVTVNFLTHKKEISY